MVVTVLVSVALGVEGVAVVVVELVVSLVSVAGTTGADTSDELVSGLWVAGAVSANATLNGLIRNVERTIPLTIL